MVEERIVVAVTVRGCAAVLALVDGVEVSSVLAELLLNLHNWPPMARTTACTHMPKAMTPHTPVMNGSSGDGFVSSVNSDTEVAVEIDVLFDELRMILRTRERVCG